MSLQAKVKSMMPDTRSPRKKHVVRKQVGVNHPAGKFFGQTLLSR